MSANEDEVTASPISWEDREAALPMPLRGGPLSPAAILLVDELHRKIILPTGMIGSRPTSLQKARKALGALLCDLFDFEAGRGSGATRRPVCGSHGMSMSDFPSGQLGFGQSIFAPIVATLHSAGLLDILPGWSQRVTFSGVSTVGRGRVTRFRMTAKLITWAETCGVALANWSTHWGQNAPPRVTASPSAPRLVLKARKVRQGARKLDAVSLPIDFTDPAPAKLRKDVNALNAYLSDHAFGGIAFPGLRRVFNDGDQPGFAWRTGGRYVTLPGGDQYENLPAAERADRIFIDGETTGEVDITASHLSFLHALLDEPFDPSELDPYALPAHPQIPRAVVKDWITQALGLCSPMANQWSVRARRSYKASNAGRILQEDIPIAVARSAILTRHPVLERLEANQLGTLDLQYHEAEVLRTALEALRDKWDVPALPIHDGIIAPASKLDCAALVLQDAFADYMAGEMGKPTRVRLSVKHKEP